MSTNLLCDSCKRVIFPDRGVQRPYTAFRVQGSSRYGDIDQAIDLCLACDLQVAKALVKLLPSLAYKIEPNCDVKRDDWARD